MDRAVSNHPSRATTRRYAWHHRELIQMLKTLGQQNRIEQQLRRQDRETQSCR